MTPQPAVRSSVLTDGWLACVCVRAGSFISRIVRTDAALTHVVVRVETQNCGTEMHRRQEERAC